MTDNKHFGFQMFWNNHDYFMPSDRKRVTDTVAELFAKEFFLRINKYKDWKEASSEVRKVILNRFKDAIRPCVFGISKTSTGSEFLDYKTLRHAQDESSSCGGGTIPKKYWEEQITVFFEEDLTEYFDEEEYV